MSEAQTQEPAEGITTLTTTMNSKPFPRLLADIGGTHARYAWQVDAFKPPSDIAVYPCSLHDSLLESIAHYLQVHVKPLPRAAGIGIATQILSDRVEMTNHHWSFSISALKRALSLDRLVVINDFTALALSLPSLQSEDLYAIGPGTAVVNAPRAVIGPGTGLGVSGLLPSAKGGYVPISGEGGHVTLAGDNPRELEVISVLKRRYGHASAERAISGPGLVNLYVALNEVDSQTPQTLSPAEVMALAKSVQDPFCVEALNLFFNFLGGIAGNLALTLGARGGIFIGGGIVPRSIDLLVESQFRERFIQKGRYRDYLDAIPTWVIRANESPALKGVAHALDLLQT
jgi:glucokinase